MNEEILTWLNSGRDFFQGVALYERYGSSASQKRIFVKGGDTRRNRDILVYELGKLALQAPSHKSGVKPVINRPEPERVNAPALAPRIEVKIERETVPEVDELRDHVKGLHKVINTLQSQLEYLPDDIKRKQAAKQILEISSEIDQCYERLRHFDKHGVLNPVKEQAETKTAKKMGDLSTDELYQRLGTLKTYVSRYKIKLEKAKTAYKRERYRVLLDNYEQELILVNKKLKRK